MRRFLLALAVPVLAVLLPSVAFAQPKLVSASPAADSRVAKPAGVTLSFSEPLAAENSGIDLVMTAMPGMGSHAPMPIKGFKTNIEGQKIRVAFPRPLPAGTYVLHWRAIGADQSKSEGSFSFTAK